MNKSFITLPLAVVVLAACSSNNPAPIESADGTLSPGMMKPVDNNATNNGSWEPQIQASESTSVSMSTSSNQQSSQSIQSATQANGESSANTSVPQKASQDFTIPRNPTTNAPDYSQIDKGFYKGNTYTVRKGDTMFLIAYISGLDVKELAALNNMKEPYNLSIGQILKVSNGQNSTVITQSTNQTTSPATPVSKPDESTITNSPAVGETTSQTTAKQSMPTPTNNADNAITVSNVKWSWPSTGNIIQGFSSADGGNKGIDIAGSRGQAVNAAAAGRVVYAGNALRGYGNLIIIKHNDDFLSAYAHNETILVKDQQQVSAGQQIAKMGSSGTNGVKLHFEIRYKGKSVDPTRYLPRR